MQTLLCLEKADRARLAHVALRVVEAAHWTRSIAAQLYYVIERRGTISKCIGAVLEERQQDVGTAWVASGRTPRRAVLGRLVATLAIDGSGAAAEVATRAARGCARRLWWRGAVLRNQARAVAPDALAIRLLAALSYARCARARHVARAFEATGHTVGNRALVALAVPASNVLDTPCTSTRILLQLASQQGIAHTGQHPDQGTKSLHLSPNSVLLRSWGACHGPHQQRALPGTGDSTREAANACCQCRTPLPLAPRTQPSASAAGLPAERQRPNDSQGG